MSNRNNIDFWYRKKRACLESNLINNFLETNYKNYIKTKNDKIFVIEEPYTGIGFPDIVFVIYDKTILNNWIDKRNILEKIDIKILHHLFNSKRKKDLNNLIIELGYSKRVLERSIQNLTNANLLLNDNNKFKINKKDKIFFLKEIITIEAKLQDWKKAFYQADLNILFSSESYVLFPYKLISNKVLLNNNFNKIGIITLNKNNYKIIRKSNKNKIPASYFSWLFNENIGRALYYEKF